MGSIFGSLGSSYAHELDIDFDGASPTSGEQKIYDQIQTLIEDGEALINELKDYKGCGDLQRVAMNAKGANQQGAESACFEALLVSVEKIHKFFTYANRLEDDFAYLLSTVCMVDADGKDQIDQKQALATQVGAILNFVLRFDQLRMMTPSLSNDFSYYRRVLSKFSHHPDIVVDSDMASSMGIFTAEHIPMLGAVNKGAQAASAGLSGLARPVPVDMGFAVLANSCLAMLKNNKYTTPSSRLFCARAMTGAIVLYDHVADLGVFHKKAPVQLKNCIVMLKTNFSQEGGLLNAIHYSTKNFRTAPSGIEALFR